MSFTPPPHTTTPTHPTGDRLTPDDGGTHPGILLRVRREALGMSAKAFANFLGINLRTVQRWESHEAPTWAMIELDAVITESVEWVDKIMDAPGPVDVWHHGWHVTRSGRVLPASWWRVVVGHAMIQAPTVTARWVD